MEVLGVLEKRVVSLVELVKRLQQEVTILTQERAKLREQLDAFEHMLLARDQMSDERGQELVVAKRAIDEMIQVIDLILEKELQAAPVQASESR